MTTQNEGDDIIITIWESETLLGKRGCAHPVTLRKKERKKEREKERKRERKRERERERKKRKRERKKRKEKKERKSGSRWESGKYKECGRTQRRASCMLKFPETHRRTEAPLNN